MTKRRAGRKALTDSQRRALGRPPKRDAALAERDRVPGLSVPVETPDAPEHLELDAEALFEWHRIARFLKFTRRISQLDRQSLAAYCVSWSAYGEAIRPLLISRQPLWGDVSGRPRPNKLEEVARRHALIVIETARRFGMTARTRHLDQAETGRPALPDELHELRGNPSKKHLRGSLQYTVGGWDQDDIEPPAWFDRVASDEWQRLIATYTNINLFTPLDYSVLAIACGTWALYLKAFEQCQLTGLIAFTEHRSAVEHPLSTIMRRQLDVMREIWIDYGMTPLDRRRFKHSADQQTQEKKRFKVYIG